MDSYFPKVSQSVMIPGPQGLLEARVDVPKHDLVKGMAVVCHPHPQHGGTLTNKVVTTVSGALQCHSMAVVRFNYRGVGKSAGSYGQAVGECEDLLAVMAWVKREFSQENLVLAGFSFGSYIAARGALAKGCKQLFLIAPPVNHLPFHELDFDLQIPPNPPFPKGGNKDFIPVVVIQGEEDEIVSSQAVYEWVRGLKNPPTVICMPQTTHFFHGKLHALKDCVMKECLG